MYLLDPAGEPVELDFVGDAPRPATTVLPEAFGVGAGLLAETLVDATSGVVQRSLEAVLRLAEPRDTHEPPRAVFCERASGLLRTSGREVVVRFRSKVKADKRNRLLKRVGLEIVRRNPTVRAQVVTAARKREGPELVEACNALVESGEVVFATPNFVSEFRRDAAVPTPPEQQWHLANLGRLRGQVAGEDVGAMGAWASTSGRESVVVAVLDDGVDIDHPNLEASVWRNPDPQSPDRYGRDFFVPDAHVDHYNPRPKQFVYPYHKLEGNDIHGTPCAGIVAACGRGAWGVAFGCRFLPVKIFHAAHLAPEERVAEAIRYAARHADVISCSWSGPKSLDIRFAIRDAGRLGRNGRGTAVFFASGNEGRRVATPAAFDETIAVGASTDMAERAGYSNYGPELDLVAPSHGGIEAIYTTDVANPPGRGFNPGESSLGGADGMHTNIFGGTSSATPLAAGVGALVLSIQPKLDREELRCLLRETAEKIGDPSGYDPGGRCDEYGYGRVSAARAVSRALAMGAAP